MDEQEAIERARQRIARGQHDDVMGDAEEYGVTLHLVADTICLSEPGGHFGVTLYESEQAARERWEALRRKYEAERLAREGESLQGP